MPSLFHIDFLSASADDTDAPTRPGTTYEYPISPGEEADIIGNALNRIPRTGIEFLGETLTVEEITERLFTNAGPGLRRQLQDKGGVFMLNYPPLREGLMKLLRGFHAVDPL